MMPGPMRRGSASRPDSTIVYPARPSGNMPPAPAFWTGDCIHTDQANYNGCGAKTGVYRRRTVSAWSLPANNFGLRAMSTSGRRTVGTPATRAHRPTAAPGCKPGVGIAPGVCCAGAAGTTAHGSCAPPTATGMPRLMPTTSSVFVSPGHSDPVSFLLYPFTWLPRSSVGANPDAPASRSIKACSKAQLTSDCRSAQNGIPAMDHENQSTYNGKWTEMRMATMGRDRYRIYD